MREESTAGMIQPASFLEIIMECRKCKAEHNGVYGSLCEDCWSLVQEKIFPPHCGTPTPALFPDRGDRHRSGRGCFEEDGTPGSGGGWG